MAKAKSEAASALAKARWAKTTKAERREYARKMVNVRWAKAKLAKEAQ